VRCYLIYLRYYGSVWPEDDTFKSKLVASLHIDNKLMCFRLILILSSSCAINLSLQLFFQVRRPRCVEYKLQYSIKYI
jgi:hypothetical protein